MISRPISRGHVSPGYEPVRDIFEKHLADGIEDRCQVCIYVKGIKVIDLYGTSPHTPKEELDFDYNSSSLQNIFSSSKVLTSLVVSMLVDRGYLQYDQKVASIWPEYGCAGKEDTTIANVMRHEAGIWRFTNSLKAIDLTPDKIRAGAVSDIIAAEVAEHVPGEKRVYHAVSRGWIVNEIVRRADPKGRTIGQFLKEEVAIPLKISDELNIGTPEHLHSKIAPLKDFHGWWAWSQLILPKFLGGGGYPISSNFIRIVIIIILPVYKFVNFFGLSNVVRSLIASIRKVYFNCFSLLSPSKSKYVHKKSTKIAIELPEYPNVKEMPWVTKSFNTKSMRMAEVPSANGHCSARALAKVAASIVEGGALKGEHRILSSEGLSNALSGENIKTMFTIMKTRFCNAGWNTFRESGGKGGRDGFQGWMGLGGSVMQWHHQLRIGFGYAMNMLEITPVNERGRALQEACVKCAQKEEEKERKERVEKERERIGKM
jgi:CubicO group peptidase (beta-lactamase class C family)